jgi:8-oxo-dGTP pyrophosphatase MutT (NUDIX family)
MAYRHTTRTAVYVILEKEEKIFFIRRANTGWADGMLTIPSGHVDKGDKIIHTAIKETREEAGVLIDEKDLEFVHVDYITDEYVNFYFKATKWEGEPHLGEPHLTSEFVWLDSKLVEDDMVPQVKNLLEKVQNGESFSEYSR